jgi:hypothetical protein
MWTDGSAQDPDPGIPENHYMVYRPIDTGGASITGPITLSDQFGVSQHTFAVLEKFANPVDKNDEGIFDPIFHQTWWLIDDPQEPRTVVVENQFGTHTWTIGDGRYLVLPATKNIAPPGPPPLDIINHYKCYDAQGPLLDLSVTLVDQFLNTGTFPVFPLYLCNPVEKQFDGQVTRMVDPDTHLACYHMDPNDVFTGLQAVDQFGQWVLTDPVSELFCVPSLKRIPTQAEEPSWGEVKSIYR